MGGGEAELTECLLNDNMTSAVLAQGTGTTVAVNRSALLGTRSGGATVRAPGGETFAVFGDGLLVADNAQVVASDSYFSGNARCGILLWNAHGQFHGNLIQGNMAYGLALEGGDSDPAQIATDNWVFGNGLNIPAGQVQQIATNPGGLSCPSLPEILGP